MVFVDTSFFVALLDPRDKNHARAKEAFGEFEGRRLSDQLLTTNNVVLETITVARYEAGHRLAVMVGEMLYAEKLARLHRTTAEEEAAAHGLYAMRSALDLQPPFNTLDALLEHPNLVAVGGRYTQGTG